ncbi:hypothetical protein BV22DRAFT_1125634 [Leucogyrophana mollusca]|uniref:Uncharacterized protein n=1 Tax=Leucogyrophana mollusca TaxID=85980 RepID=A0ACB8BV70_9AGAM|nr:hypothetical protein BV22DRAFT_1125634 [Leucogyrophana mollusca]
MPVFYPDNVQRGDRLQQLIDDIANIQTQIANQSDTMDKADKSSRQSLNDLLASQGMTTFDQLMNEILGEMTPDQRQQYQDMIDFNKKFGDVTDDIMQISSMIFTVAIIANIAIDVTIFTKTVGMMRVVKGYATGFKLLVTEGFDVAFSYFKDFRAGLEIVTEEFTEASRFGKILGTAAEFCEFLGWAGVVVDGIILIMQAVEGAEQKTKLIDGIHQTQIARLASAYFNTQAIQMSAQIDSLSDWIMMRSSTDPDDQAAAKVLAKTIAKRIAQDVDTVTLEGTEELLEGQDNSRSHYSADDLSRADVIAGATATIAK